MREKVYSDILPWRGRAHLTRKSIVCLIPCKTASLQVENYRLRRG